jgi:hypothetical protein
MKLPIFLLLSAFLPNVLLAQISFIAHSNGYLKASTKANNTPKKAYNKCFNRRWPKVE